MIPSCFFCGEPAFFGGHQVSILKNGTGILITICAICSKIDSAAVQLIKTLESCQEEKAIK